MDKYINAPISDEDAKSLHSGDYVYITGTIYTARDAAHKRMAAKKIPRAHIVMSFLRVRDCFLFTVLV